MANQAKFPRERIVEAAFALVREEGHEALSARRVAGRLNCSTQPVLYQFPTVEALRRAVYEAADRFHTAYLLDLGDCPDGPMLALGLRYVRFAAEESALFRFLFQSGEFAGRGLDELIAAPEAAPLLEILSGETGLDRDGALLLFRALFAAVHGFASLAANNGMRLDEAAVAGSLTDIYTGMLTQMGGMKDGPTVQEE